MQRMAKLATQREIVNAAMNALWRAVGTLDTFPKDDMIKQADWRSDVHQAVAHLEREMCTYHFLVETATDD